MQIDTLYRDIIDNLEDGIYFVDAERRFVVWNNAAERITGYTAEEVLGRQCQDNILNHIDMEGRPLCLTGCPLFDTLGDGKVRVDEVLLRHKDGHRIAVLAKILPVYENGEVVGAVEIFTPKAMVASDSQLVDALTDQIMTDSLTGLPNRVYLESFFQYKLQEYKRFGNYFCVLFMDIDNFHIFNNSYGHHVGDTVLTSIAESFKHNLRETDAMGRWGGEEFVGIFTLRNKREACIVAEKVRTLVAGSEVLHEGRRLNVTASIGVACIAPTDTIDSIVERADAMMYESKNRGKNCVSVEDPDTDTFFTKVPELEIIA